MAAPTPRLNGLPMEILEHVLLHLPGQDIVKIEAISRRFQDLVRSSPTIHHRRELFSAGLAENTNSPCGFAERRKLCEEYVHKWSAAASAVKSIRELPKGPFSDGSGIMILSKNFITSQPIEDRELAFLRIPPFTTRRAVEGWSIPPLRFEPFIFTAYTPENILAVVEQRGRLIYINLLNLQNGSPYCEPPFDVIMWELPPRVSNLEYPDAFAITDSRIMIYASYQDPDLPGDTSVWSIRVWDWKTGDLVLDLSTSNGCGLIRRVFTSCRPTFVDEFRLILFTYDNPREDSELIVFNTLIPQDHPSNSRRFSVPSRPNDWGTCIHVDRDRNLGTPDMDEPLIADPAQVIFVVELAGAQGTTVLVAVQTQALIEYACAPRTDFGVPLDDWGKGAVVMEIPRRCNYLSTSVHGTKVVVQTLTGVQLGQPPSYRIHTFDFSWRGCSSLRLLNEEGGGTGREARFEDGRSFEFKGSEGMRSRATLESLGDGSLLYPELLDNTPRSDAGLHIWELV